MIEQSPQLRNGIGMHIDTQVQFGNIPRSMDKNGRRAFRQRAGRALLSARGPAGFERPDQALGEILFCSADRSNAEAIARRMSSPARTLPKTA